MKNPLLKGTQSLQDFSALHGLRIRKQTSSGFRQPVFYVFKNRNEGSSIPRKLGCEFLRKRLIRDHLCRPQDLKKRCECPSFTDFFIEKRFTSGGIEKRQHIAVKAGHVIGLGL